VTDMTATDGRVIGRRAILTRRRILNATAALLREQGALDLKVIDVAREVGTSPATFYQYFADVEDAILALATDLVTEVAPISAQLTEDWSGSDGLDLARRFVSDYTTFWDDHAAVLRIMLLRADERDERFRQIRREYNAPFMSAMAAKVKSAQGSGRLAPELDAEATAGAMLAALDRLPNYREMFERRGTTRSAMIETMARLLHSSLTGVALI
jgi:AcrR family transcriptional regulator